MNRFKLLVAVMVLGVSLAGAPAYAADWSYVEAAYAAKDVNDRSSDVASLAASVEVGEHVFLQGQYAKGLDTDLKAGVASVAVGLHDGLLYGKVTGSIVVADRRDLDKVSFAAEGGLRGAVTDKFELRGGVIYDNLRSQAFDFGGWMATVGGEYAFTDAFRVGVDVRGRDSFAEGRASVRWYF